MYLSDEQVLGILNELRPFHAEEGKAAKESTSCLLRFLAFDLLCKSQNLEKKVKKGIDLEERLADIQLRNKKLLLCKQN